MAKPKVIDAYMSDLKGLLDESSIMEQKAFFRSFIKAIEVGKTDVISFGQGVPLWSPVFG